MYKKYLHLNASGGGADLQQLFLAEGEVYLYTIVHY
jgi:hypothetical protein